MFVCVSVRLIFAVTIIATIYSNEGDKKPAWAQFINGKLNEKARKLVFLVWNDFCTFGYTYVNIRSHSLVYYPFKHYILFCLLQF